LLSEGRRHLWVGSGTLANRRTSAAGEHAVNMGAYRLLRKAAKCAQATSENTAA
jgi:hypothetical protein